MSFAVKNHENIDSLKKLIFDFESEYLKEVFVFDYFENSKQGITKIGFRFSFQSKNETLTDQDVNNLISGIIQSSMQMKGIEIPGLEK